MGTPLKGSPFCPQKHLSFRKMAPKYLPRFQATERSSEGAGDVFTGTCSPGLGSGPLDGKNCKGTAAASPLCKVQATVLH